MILSEKLIGMTRLGQGSLNPALYFFTESCHLLSKGLGKNLYKYSGNGKIDALKELFAILVA
ncbi:hypothetical protein [Anaerocolumna jejuensis]|uniref:hypothetical protein n=1 Tax=Anaerocolumna jejuensis TaxID=259063 RepID=UPI003F7B7053